MVRSDGATGGSAADAKLWALHALPTKTVYVSPTLAAAIRQYNRDVGSTPLHIHQSSISRWLRTDPTRRRATTKGGVVVYRWEGALAPEHDGHRVVQLAS